MYVICLHLSINIWYNYEDTIFIILIETCFILQDLAEYSKKLVKYSEKVIKCFKKVAKYLKKLEKYSKKLVKDLKMIHMATDTQFPQIIFGIVIWSSKRHQKGTEIAPNGS